jgi:acetylornithine deacetylase/succinyl-diaminopimelate desuccinylase-like protein
MSDSRMSRRDGPALTYGLRGGLNLEFEVHGPKTDLHSGNFGGAIQNPLQVVCETVARLHQRDGRIAIPHFYDRVCRVPQAERDYMARVGPSDQQVLASAASQRGWGEPGFSLYERTTIRPSLSVTGITGGYNDSGVKAVIPSRAVAKLNFRLVPDQKPDEIEKLARDHLASNTTPGTRFAIRTLLKAEPALIDRRHPAMRAAALACKQSFGTAPVFLRSGGTIPVVTTFQKQLGFSTVLLGFALPDDQRHGPNERFYLPTFRKGIMTSIRFLTELGRTT